MTDETDDMQALEPVSSMPMTNPTAIAALALNMALKYHDTCMIKDGATYQQYKLEGRNMRELNLDMVFETAILIEEHLTMAPDRIAAMVSTVIEHALDQMVEEEGHDPDNHPGD